MFLTQNNKRRQSRRRSGQILVLTALGITTLLGILGLALDGGHLFAQRRQMQNAADAAAFAGARVMAQRLIESQGDFSRIQNSEVWNTIDTYARNNKVVNPSTDVEAYYTDGQNARLARINPGGGGTAQAGYNGVEVVTRHATPTFFLRVIGIPVSQVVAVAAARTIPGQSNSGYAIFAMRSPVTDKKGRLDIKKGKKAVEIKAGSKKPSVITGAIHSNHGLTIKGKKFNLTVDGNANLVSGYYPVKKKTGEFKGRVNFNPPLGNAPPYRDQLRRVEPMPDYPVQFNLADFRPGGPEASDAGANYYNISELMAQAGKDRHHVHVKDLVELGLVEGGDKNGKGGTLKDGIYFVEGDFHLKFDESIKKGMPKGLGASRVTFVATGKIKIDAKASELAPYTKNLFAFSGLDVNKKGKRKTSTKIKVKKGSTVGGIVFAPNSNINFKLEKSTFNGSLIGWMVKMKGKEFTFTAPPGTTFGGGAITLYK